MKGEYVMPVPETADGFRATIIALRSFGGDEGVSFRTFSLREDRCARLLLNILGKSVAETEINEELETLHIQVQLVMRLLSRRRYQDAEKDRPLTPQFVLFEARGPDVCEGQCTLE
jgi:hypothetical protein